MALTKCVRCGKEYNVGCNAISGLCLSCRSDSPGQTKKIYIHEFYGTFNNWIQEEITSFFKPPIDYHDLIEATIEIYNDEIGTLAWRLDCNWGSVGQRWNHGHRSINGKTTLDTRNSIIDVTKAFEHIGVGDVITFTFTRNAQNAQDTVPSFIKTLWLRLDYNTSSTTKTGENV